jgi:hypothetical protein
MVTKAEQDVITAAEKAAVAEAPGVVEEIAHDVEAVVKRALALGEQEIENYRRAHAGTPYVQPSHTELPPEAVYGDPADAPKAAK